PAGEGDHPRPEGDMPLEERSPLKRLRHASDGNEKAPATRTDKHGSRKARLRRAETNPHTR
ncbi:MAG TPA: hypothetical protein VF232_06115, partial [Gaiellaceae bacterium]